MAITFWRSFLSIAVLVTATYCIFVTADQAPDDEFCEPFWMDCDKNASNGCETNVALDDLNCGVCGESCYLNTTERKAPPWTYVYCIVGMCYLECEYKHLDCDDDPWGTGCETELTDEDSPNCGGCIGQTCQDPHRGPGDRRIPVPPHIYSEGNLQVQFVRGIPQLVAAVSLIGGLINIFA